jgi:transcriptional antiterminator RfaH
MSHLAQPTTHHPGQQSPNPDLPRWYVIHTKPKQEERADSNLKAWRVETFAPKLRELRFDTAAGRRTYVTKPLFARYIFARFKADELLHKVCYTRGVKSVVCLGAGPTPVDDEIIEFIQLRRDEDGFIKAGDDPLRPGDRVVISDGYLKDLAGVFESNLKDHDRVTILLTAISYQGRVIIEKDFVRKAN